MGYKYAFKKILRIVSVCFLWEFLHATAYWLYYGETRDFITSFVLDFFQRGLFYHFWYFGALVILYLLMPAMHRILKESRRKYLVVLGILSGVNIIIDLIAVAVGEQFILSIPQNLRLWIWLLYAMVGGYIAELKLKGQPCRISPTKKLLAVVGALLLMMIWVYSVGTGVFSSIAVEGFYGSWAVQAAAIAVFLAFTNGRFSEKSGKVIVYLSGLTMGVFITHPFVLAVLKKFIPILAEGGILWDMVFWLGTAGICGIISVVIQKVPLLNRLIRL